MTVCIQELQLGSCQCRVFLNLDDGKVSQGRTQVEWSNTKRIPSVAFVRTESSGFRRGPEECTVLRRTIRERTPAEGMEAGRGMKREHHVAVRSDEKLDGN